MTSHELARKLLNMEELPIYFLDDNCSDFIIEDNEILSESIQYLGEKLPKRIRLS